MTNDLDVGRRGSRLAYCAPRWSGVYRSHLWRRQITSTLWQHVNFDVTLHIDHHPGNLEALPQCLREAGTETA